MAAGRHHDALQKHAVVQQAAAAQAVVHGEHEADRRVKEPEVALVLGMHLVLVALADAQQAVQAPAVFTAPINEGRDPFFRVVVVSLFVVSGQLRIGAYGVMGGADLANQRVTAGALQHINLPGLGVDPRGRATGDIEQVHQGIALYGVRQKSAHRQAAGNRLVHGVHALAGSCVHAGDFLQVMGRGK